MLPNVARAKDNDLVTGWSTIFHGEKADVVADVGLTEEERRIGEGWRNSRRLVIKQTSTCIVIQ